MALAAAGSLSLPLEHLESIVSFSSTFQTWVGEITPAAAKAHFFMASMLGAAVKAGRPFAFADIGEEFAKRKVAGGGNNVYIEEGGLYLLFEGAVPVEYKDNQRDAQMNFTNTVGQIIDDIAALSGGEDVPSGTCFYNITEINMISPPMRSEKKIRKKEGDYFEIWYNIMHGTI